MSINRYAKFISEQARIAKLDEAKKTLGITFARPKQYNLEDNNRTVFGNITHEQNDDGKWSVRLKYRNGDVSHEENFPADGEFHDPHLVAALKKAQEIHKST